MESKKVLKRFEKLIEDLEDDLLYYRERNITNDTWSRFWAETHEFIKGNK